MDLYKNIGSIFLNDSKVQDLAFEYSYLQEINMFKIVHLHVFCCLGVLHKVFCTNNNDVIISWHTVLVCYYWK